MRTLARETVYKYLFSTLFNGQDDKLFIALLNDGKLTQEDRKFAKKLYKAVTENYDGLLSDISRLAIGYNVDRIFNSDKCLMLIAMCEMKYFDDIPNVVSIDEAVTLAEKYSTEKSLGFINGILGKFNKELTK